MNETPKYLLSILLGTGIVYRVLPTVAKPLIQAELTLFSILTGSLAGLSANVLVVTNVFKTVDYFKPIPLCFLGHCVTIAVFSSCSSAFLGGVLGAQFT